MKGKVQCTWRFGLLAMLALLVVLGCSRKQQIVVDGSSTVYPITEGVAEEYRKQDSSVHVTVGISGTGGGFTKFCNRETQISDASRHIKKTEREECAKNNVAYVEVPVAYDGLAIVLNKDNDFVKQLTVAQLEHIFRTKEPATSWKQIDPKYPDLPIKVFSPGQDSGTFDYFVETILGKKAKVRSDATFSEDDNVLVTGVAGNKGAIGFFGVAYYEENKDKLVLCPIVNPKTQVAVRPNLETVKSGAYFPLSRPLFIYVSTEALKSPSINRFVRFYLDNAGRLSKDVGYIPLEDARYEQGRKALGF